MITVTSPGARTLVEDLGRPGYEHLGVPTSGAADPQSLTVANLLAGNPANTAALEVALHGPTLTFHTDTVVAYAGSPVDLLLDDAPAPNHHTLHVRAGQTLRIGGLRDGVYGYLAVHGGIDTAPVLGSRSSCTLSGLGPAPLAPGDSLPLVDTARAATVRAMHAPATRSRTVRYLPGPHADRFGTAACAQFAQTRWAISPDTSRVGIRLTGEALSAPSDSLPSLGMVTGAIQIPPNGHPIVLGPDHGTTGGYPVIGVVVAEDMPVLVQQVPGTTIRFVPVDLNRALSTEAAAPRLLDLDAISA